MYKKLEKVVQETGIWEGERRSTHGFLLSSSVYQITQDQKQKLQKLGFALYDCLLGLSHIAAIAGDQSLNYQGAWQLVRKVFSTGVPAIYQKTQVMNVRHIPALLKVDFMLDEKGSFLIAEIDGHNKHGVGYSTLAKLFRLALHNDCESFPGTVELLADEVRRQGEDTLKLLYADQEKFYLPEFEVARDEFKRNGIDCRVISEMEVDDDFVSSGIFLDLPFLYHKENIYQKIIPAYQNGSAKFIIPPKPFLGAKGVIGLLRNDSRNSELEALLITFIKRRSLELVRSHIPETFLIGKMAMGFNEAKALFCDKTYVLKESISSGMKGTIFSDNPSFEKMLKEASKTKLNWILQKEVRNQPQEFSWYKNGSGEPLLETASDWFMRVTVQYVNRQVADVIVTARRDKAVHGAKDCIQIGTIIT